MFGTFEFRVNGSVIEGLQGDRTKSILARLLLYQDKSVQRAQLADELWPESSAKQARTNLRRELHSLRNRHAIFQECVTSDQLCIKWSTSSDFEFDVDNFNSTYERFKATSCNSDRLKTGENLLSQPIEVLIPGYHSEWIEKQRDLLKSRWLYVAEELVSIYKKKKELQDALRLAKDITNILPHKESTYLQLMQLHLLQGDNAMALHAYHQCATVLQDELGVEPSSEIKNLYVRVSKNTNSAKKTLKVSEHDTDQFGTNYFAGREVELQLITSLINPTEKHDRSQIVLITGVAGIGKTRLVHEWVKKYQHQIDYFGKSRCYEARGSHPFSPIVSWLQHEKAQKLLSSAAAGDSSVIRNTLLPTPEKPDAGNFNQKSAPATRERIFDALAATLKSNSEIQRDIQLNRVFFLDDLQWCDQDTFDLLDHLLMYDGHQELFFIATVRSEAITPGSATDKFCNTLVSRGQLQKVSVGNLSRKESKQLINSTSPAQHVKAATSHDLTIDEMCVRAGGHPLFLLEIARFQFDKRSEARDLSNEDGNALPPRVEAVIQQRINHLSPDAALVASYAAVMGAEFSIQLLNALENMEQESLICSMDELWQKYIITQTEHGQYLFSHDCIREVCYQIIPAPQRQLLHGQVASALEKYHEQHIGGISARIAFHCREAGEYESAYKWYLKAMHYAEFSLVAHNEIVELSDSILKLLQRDKIDVDRNLSRLKVISKRASAIGILEGYGSPKLRPLCEELETLITNVNDLELRTNVVHRLRLYHSFSSNPNKALKFAEDQIKIARAMPEPKFLVDGHFAKSFVEFQLGNFESAYRTAELGSESANVAEHKNTLDAQQPSHHLLMLHALGTWAYHTCGFANKARVLFQKCSLFETCTGAFNSRGHALFWITRAHLVAEEMEQVALNGKRLISRGQDKSLLKHEILGNFFCGTAAVTEGMNELGLEHLNFSIQRYEELKESVLSGEFHLWASRAHSQMNNHDSALISVENAFEETRRSKTQPFIAEMHTQKAQILAELGEPAADVLKEFESSLRIAELQQADLVKLKSIHLEYNYRSDNNLPTSSLLKNTRELANRMSRHGSSPAIARVNRLLAESQMETCDEGKRNTT